MSGNTGTLAQFPYYDHAIDPDSVASITVQRDYYGEDTAVIVTLTTGKDIVLAVSMRGGGLALYKLTVAEVERARLAKQAAINAPLLHALEELRKEVEHCTGNVVQSREEFFRFMLEHMR